MIWPLILKYRVVICLAVAGLVVLGAVYNKGRIDGTAAGDRRTLRMYEAAQAVVRKRDLLIASNLEIYREEIAAVSARKPKRVYLCPSVPEAPGGAAGASPADLDRHDYGPDLRAARDALIRCNALIGIVQ